MWIKFIKAKAGLAYFKDNKVDMPDKEANELIESGYALPVDALPPKTDLPELLPGREMLIRGGLLTKKQVLNSKETLTDIPGISAKLAERIVEQLSLSI